MIRSPAPFVIVLEGLDFSGKSTQAGLLHAAFEQAGIPCRLYRDPGGTPGGEAIRAVLKNKDVPLPTTAQMLMFTAARSILAEQVRADLQAGRMVVLDRWWPSTYAYQGTLGSDVNDIADLTNRYAMLPEQRLLMILVDVPISTLLRRKRGQAEPGPADRFDDADVTFRQKVLARYHALAAKGTLQIVEGDRSVEDVTAQLVSMYTFVASRIK
jgi:dTMP kinase